MNDKHTAEKDTGCPSCGGYNLAAMGRHVWCNECDWIDPPEHQQFTDDTGTWCHRDCLMPDDECGRLAVEQNGMSRVFPPGSSER